MIRWFWVCCSSSWLRIVVWGQELGNYQVMPGFISFPKSSLGMYLWAKLCFAYKLSLWCKCVPKQSLGTRKWHRVVEVLETTIFWNETECCLRLRSGNIVINDRQGCLFYWWLRFSKPPMLCVAFEIVAFENLRQLSVSVSQWQKFLSFWASDRREWSVRIQASWAEIGEFVAMYCVWEILNLRPCLYLWKSLSQSIYLRGLSWILHIGRYTPSFWMTRVGLRITCKPVRLPRRSLRSFLAMMPWMISKWWHRHPCLCLATSSSMTGKDACSTGGWVIYEVVERSRNQQCYVLHLKSLPSRTSGNCSVSVSQWLKSSG